jgi:hypothetical protein
MGTMHDRRHHGAAGGTIARQLVRDQSPGGATLWFQQLATESDGSASISSGLHQDVDLVPIRVDRPPQVLLPALNPDEQLIPMPGVALPPPPGPQPSSVVGPERQAPLADRLLGDRDSANREEILHVPETETEPVVHPDRVTDGLGRKPVSSVARHTATVPGPPSS